MSKNDAELLKEAREALSEYKEIFDRLSKAALGYGIVIQHLGDKMMIKTATGGMFLVPRNDNYPVGTGLILHPETQQIIDVVVHPKIGDTNVVANVRDDCIEINRNGHLNLVSKGCFSDLEKGDTVLLDFTNSVVVERICKAEKPRHVAEVKPVTWEDVGGQEEAKRLLREAIELPHQHPEIFAFYNKKPTSGILLFGEPGCGKTLLAKATATSIGANGGFLSLKGPEVLDPYVGVAEANVRNIFAQAKEYKTRTGKPAVIFIDEAEAILGHRGGHHFGMEKTIVPAFLAEMNGMEESSAIVILATNREDQLDSAILRDGRIDFKVKVGRPNAEMAKDILGIHFKNKPVDTKFTAAGLIDMVVSKIYDATVSWLPYSGALLEGIVEKAAVSAIRRDLSAKTKTGIGTNDIVWAVNTTIAQEQVNKHANSKITY